jgi:hypothetical protein
LLFRHLGQQYQWVKFFFEKKYNIDTNIELMLYLYRYCSTTIF